MTNTPYRVLIKFTPQCDILRAACTCLAGFASQGKGNCNHIGGVLFAFKMLQDEVCRKTPRTTFLHIASFGMGRPTQSERRREAPWPYLNKDDKIWEENIHLKPKVIKFDPRPPQQREIDDRRFEWESSTFSSFFSFNFRLQLCRPSHWGTVLKQSY